MPPVLEEKPWPFDLEHLFNADPLRLAHMYSAASFARDLGLVLGLTPKHQELLERAALAHDLGYAPDLNQFDFHPLDGALFLEKHDQHPWVIQAVLRHSMAERKAMTNPDLAREYAQRPLPPKAQWIVRLTTIADWRAAGIGGRVSFGQRLEDIVLRNPGNAAKARRAQAMVQEVRAWFGQEMLKVNHEQPLPWVFCDLDNTLVRPGDTLDKRSYQAITAYAQAQGNFSLATGKHPLSIAPLVADLGLKTSQIAANGSCLVHQGQIEVISHLGSQAQDLCAQLNSWGLPSAIYRLQGIEAGQIWPETLDDLFALYGEIRPVHHVLPGPILKVLCVADVNNEKQEQDLRALAQELKVDICRSDQHFLEFLPPQGNKGLAVQKVMNQAQWPVLHSVAVGDAENDGPMFALCGASLAVANASDHAQRGADKIIDACVEHGVAQVLEDLMDQGGWPALQYKSA